MDILFKSFLFLLMVEFIIFNWTLMSISMHLKDIEKRMKEYVSKVDDTRKQNSIHE